MWTFYKLLIFGYIVEIILLNTTQMTDFVKKIIYNGLNKKNIKFILKFIKRCF